MAYHIAQSGEKAGEAVTCPAKNQCTLRELDGSFSPHFYTKNEGDKWAVAQRHAASGGSHLQGTSRGRQSTQKGTTKKNQKGSLKSTTIPIVNKASKASDLQPGYNEVTSSSLAARLAQTIEGTDDRAGFMETALKRAAIDEKWTRVRTFVVMDESGKRVVAAGNVSYSVPVEDTASEFGDDDDDFDEDYEFPPHATLTEMGAEAGHGAALAKVIRREVEVDGTPLYLQATKDSNAFWQKQGLVVDPRGWGVDFYGWK